MTLQVAAATYRRLSADPPYAPKKHKAVGLLIGITLLAGAVSCSRSDAKKSNDATQTVAKVPALSKEPTTVVPGKAFRLDAFSYAAGWRVGKDSDGALGIAGLKVQNRGDAKDIVVVKFKFYKGGKLLGSSSCIHAQDINVGQTVTLTCISVDGFGPSYDKVTINNG